MFGTLDQSRIASPLSVSAASGEAVFDQVRTAIEALRVVLRGLEPECLDGSLARQLVEAFAEVERLGGAGKALAARRVAQTGAWKQAGCYRDAASWMASVAGTTVSQGAATLETAARLEALPETEEALRAGALSGAQVDAIAAAATADRNAERELLESAHRDGMKGLRENCARVRAAACRDEVARYQVVRERRSLRHWTDPDGAGRIDIRGPVDATAAVLAALDPYERELFKAARDSGNRERPDALAFDALVAMSTAAIDRGSAVTSKSAPPTLVVRVDHTAFMRGHTETGETCEIAGVGPIPVAVAQRLADDCFLKVLLTDGEDVRTVAHAGRVIPARLRTAVEEQYPECCLEGCDVTHHLEIDHNVPVSEGGLTELSNLQRLCPHHHDHKHAHRLRLEGSGTRKHFVSTGPSPPGRQGP